jgi:hypothetical protein
MAAVGETAAQIGLRERERKAAERRLRERGVCHGGLFHMTLS